jgi:transposase
MSQHYVGLDVSLDLVHICVVDEDGVPVWRGKCAVCPATIARHLREHAPHLVRAGLETGQFAPWLTLQLRRRKIRTLCIDALHAYAALKLQRNKTDAGDALGLAQIIRTGWYREVAVKSMDAHSLRMLLLARRQ